MGFGRRICLRWLFLCMVYGVIYCNQTCAPVCGFVKWTEWHPCQPSGTQTRNHSICCPEDLSPRTLEACTKRCNIDINTVTESQGCTYVPTTVPTTTVKPITLPTTTPTTVKVTTPASTTRATRQSTIVTNLKTLLPTLTSLAKSTTLKATTTTTVSSVPSTVKQSTSTTANARTTGTPSSKPPTTTASITTTAGNVTAKGRIQGPSGKAESSSSPLPGAIGGVIGVLFLAAVASGVFYLLWKRKKRGRDEKVHPSTPDLKEAETKDAPPMENGAPPSDHRV